MQQKGAALRSTFRAIETLHGEAVSARIRARMPADVRAKIEPTIVIAGWYPIEVGAALHVAVRDELGGGTSWEPSRALGRAAAEIDFKGIYRVLLRGMRYDTIWDRIERAWNGYSSRGRFRWIERGEGLMRVEIHDVDGFNTGMWLGSAGRAMRLMELAGAKTAEATLLESTSSRAVFEVMWLT